MVQGWKNVELALKIENDERNPRVAETNLVDKRLEKPNQNSQSNQVVITTGEPLSSLAKEKKVGSKLHEDVVRAELRVKMLRSLTKLGVGTNRIELNQIKSRNELVRDSGRRT